jgi:hypothetical protein
MPAARVGVALAVWFGAAPLTPLYQASAQSHASLTGRVLDMRTRSPVPMARVFFTGLRDTLTADHQGRFSADTVPTGAHVLEVRAIGYGATRWTLELQQGPLDITIELDSRIPTVLDTIVVRARHNFDDPNDWRSPAAFERRRQARAGWFLSADEVSRTNARSLAEILRTVPGIMVACSNRRCDVRLAGVRPCIPAYYLDGSPASNSTGPDFPLNRVAGIEVYRQSEAPIEFQAPNARCGVVAIWTRMDRN